MVVVHYSWIPLVMAPCTQVKLVLQLEYVFLPIFSVISNSLHSSDMFEDELWPQNVASVSWLKDMNVSVVLAKELRMFQNCASRPSFVPLTPLKWLRCLWKRGFEVSARSWKWEPTTARDTIPVPLNRPPTLPLHPPICIMKFRGGVDPKALTLWESFELALICRRNSHCCLHLTQPLLSFSSAQAEPPGVGGMVGRRKRRRGRNWGGGDLRLHGPACSVIFDLALMHLN